MGITTILDYSEIWALLFPLALVRSKKNYPLWLRPVIGYLMIAFVLDALIVIGHITWRTAPSWLHPNNYLYNLHSILRYVCFGIFFVLLSYPPLNRFKAAIFGVSLLAIGVNFFFEDFFYAESFSNRLLAAEAGLLLAYCLQYYFDRLSEDKSTRSRPVHFWIVTGLAIYVVFNFTYFLFYRRLLATNKEALKTLWYLHNVTFIILCLFTAKALHVANGR